MSAQNFDVYEHTAPAQHLREFYRGQANESDRLQLYAREYRPKNNPKPGPGSLTLIFAHGNSEPGTCVEPMWDDLLAACNSLNVSIRAIWAIDAYNKGQSGVINENHLGDDPSLFDFSRDILSFINHYAPYMVRPIVGIGHSAGAASLIHTSIMHPRLFHSLILLECIFSKAEPSKLDFQAGSAKRPDLWPSRAAAAAYFRQHPFFKLYEPRMLDAYMRANLRETPTPTYPGNTAPPGYVTLKTTKAQETWSLGRPNWQPGVDPDVEPLDERDRLLFPDASTAARRYRTIRAECQQAELELANLRPGVLWVYGADSAANVPEWREDQVARTGTGDGGNRGVKAGMVRRVDVEGAGHNLPQQKPVECAKAMADWLEREARRFRDEEKFLSESGIVKSRSNYTQLDEGFVKELGRGWQRRPIRGEKL